MSLFETLAYLSPLAAGFGVAAALALTHGRPARRRLAAAGAVVGGILVLLLFASFADRPRLWFPLAVLIASFALLAAGLYLVGEAARAPREVSQILSGLGVCLLMSTVFWLGPIIRSMADAGASGEVLYRRISLAMSVNPYFVTAYSIFKADLLRLPFFYRTDLAGFQSDLPSWPGTAAGYALAGALLGAISAGLRRLLPR